MNRALITILLVLLIVASGGYIYYYMTAPPAGVSLVSKQADTDATEAQGESKPAALEAGPIVSHTEYETANTRIRAVLALRHIADTIHGFIPEDLLEKAPGGIGRTLNEDFANVLPYEVALLGGAEEQENRFEIIFFANQRYFAPLVTMIPQLRGLPIVLPILEFEDPAKPIYSSAPTVVEGTAFVAIPESVANTVAETWPAQEAVATDAAPVTAVEPITGDQLLEISIDNTEGDLMSMIFSLMEANGVAYDRFKDMQQFQMAEGILRDIATARLVANVADNGDLLLDLRLNAVENPSAALVSVLPSMANGFAIGMLNTQLTPYDVTVEGKMEYDDQAGALVGDFRVKGFQQAIETQVKATIEGEEDEEATASAAPAPEATAAPEPAQEPEAGQDPPGEEVSMEPAS